MTDTWLLKAVLNNFLVVHLTGHCESCLSALECTAELTGTTAVAGEHRRNCTLISDG